MNGGFVMSRDKDPAELFREWVNQWERAVDSFSNQLMGTDEFSRAMNTMQNSQLQFQKVFGELMAQHLANLNMPSRRDVQHLAEVIHDLDTRLARMEVKLDRLSAASGATSATRPGPKRTRKPPSATSPANKKKD